MRSGSQDRRQPYRMSTRGTMKEAWREADRTGVRLRASGPARGLYCDGESPPYPRPPSPITRRNHMGNQDGTEERKDRGQCNGAPHPTGMGQSAHHLSSKSCSTGVSHSRRAASLCFSVKDECTVNIYTLRIHMRGPFCGGNRKMTLDAPHRSVLHYGNLEYPQPRNKASSTAPCHGRTSLAPGRHRCDRSCRSRGGCQSGVAASGSS